MVVLIIVTGGARRSPVLLPFHLVLSERDLLVLAELACCEVLAPVRVRHVDGAWLPLGVFLDVVNETNVFGLARCVRTHPLVEALLGDDKWLNSEW